MEDLLDVEAMMIAPLHTVMSCYNLKGHGQMFYGGHVVALPRDITRLVNAVPLLPEDLDAIIVRPPDLDPEEVAKLDAFTIRPAVIAHWLDLLRIYHPAYKSGAIISDENMQTLRDRLPAGADGFSVYKMLQHINAVGVPVPAAGHCRGPGARRHSRAPVRLAGPTVHRHANRGHLFRGRSLHPPIRCGPSGARCGLTRAQKADDKEPEAPL
jgi:hypothetical protein